MVKGRDPVRNGFRSAEQNVAFRFNDQCVLRIFSIGDVATRGAQTLPFRFVYPESAARPSGALTRRGAAGGRPAEFFQRVRRHGWRAAVCWMVVPKGS